MPEEIEVKISRTAETILGVLGGVFGLGGAIFAFFIGGVAGILGSPDASTVAGASLGAIFLSILGIVGGSIASRSAKTAGILMLLSGIGGFIAISFAFIIAGPLLIIGGILALTRKPKEKQS